MRIGQAFFERLHRRSLDCGAAPEERATAAVRELQRLRGTRTWRCSGSCARPFGTFERAVKGELPPARVPGSRRLSRLDACRVREVVPGREQREAPRGGGADVPRVLERGAAVPA
jgi:hypothetical protein